MAITTLSFTTTSSDPGDTGDLSSLAVPLRPGLRLRRSSASLLRSTLERLGLWMNSRRWSSSGGTLVTQCMDGASFAVRLGCCSFLYGAALQVVLIPRVAVALFPVGVEGQSGTG